MLVVLVSCSLPPSTWQTDKLWKVELVRPEGRLNPNARLYSNTEKLREEAGYYLYLLTDAVGISFADAEAFLETLHKHPRGSKASKTVGHAWIMLESPEEILEVGHTGEFGIVSETYSQRFVRKIRQGDPDPISALWARLPDGKL